MHPQGSAFAAAAGHESASSAAFAVVGRLEWSGQAVQIEALAVNKDLVAVAGHCPAIRWAPALLVASTPAGGCGQDTLSWMHQGAYTEKLLYIGE